MRFARDLALIAAAGLVAAGVGLLWTAPAPLFSSDHAVPRVLELRLQDAERKISALGFRPRFTGTEQHPSVPVGFVVGQDPPPGVVLPPGSVVELVTSAGRAPVIVPDVVGFATPHALRVLQAAGLQVATVDSVADGADAPNVVIATRPPAGNTEDAGTTIGLVVSASTAGRP
jgi:serine/threonine-protein kinase